MNKNLQDVLLSIANNSILAIFGLIATLYADLNSMPERTKDIIFFRTIGQGSILIS
jgi:hypothetical protein